MNLKLVFAILWAVLGMGAWTFTEWRASNEGTVVEFKVVGYDPRDLLAGHYVTYDVVYGSEPVCRVRGDDPQVAYAPERCLCLNVDPEDRLASVSSVEHCDKNTTPTCNLWIRGACLSGRFQAGIERFYIPEKYSPYLLVIPDDAKIVVNITAKGRAKVRDLRIAGNTLENFIAEAIKRSE
jgi:uncharacterized membrane-anchored protein